MTSADVYSSRVNFSQPVDPTRIFGPQRDSLLIVLPITIIYSLIFIIGLLGNIFTCLVIVRNKSMHTATNYYLFSLAISDLLLLISGMPQEIYSIWSKWPYVFGQSFCVIRGLAAETSTNASVLTITLFTIERHLAICHPFVSHKMSKLSRATKHVIALWVVAFALALPQALQFGIKDHKGVVMCLQTRVIIEHLFEIATFVFFLAPMILITVLYALIGLKLRETSLDSQKNQRDFERSLSYTHKMRRKNNQSTRRVVKMLVAVVIAFFVCWAPFHAQRLVAIYGTTENHRARSPVLLSVYNFLTYSSGVFYYMSTCINPIFYHIMSNKFRDAFKNTMTVWCCQPQKGAATKRCSYSAMAFVRNPTSSGTGNSGNSLKNDTSFRNKYRRQESREKTQSQIMHVCINEAGLVTPSTRDYKSSGHYTEDTKHSTSENCEQNIQKPKNDISSTDKDDSNAKQISCSSCCLTAASPDSIQDSRDPESNSSTNQTKNETGKPKKYFAEIKLKIIHRGDYG